MSNQRVKILSTSVYVDVVTTYLFNDKEEEIYLVSGKSLPGDMTKGDILDQIDDDATLSLI